MQLPLERKFLYLGDGVTKRRCIICYLRYRNISYNIMEVEREEKSISTLILSNVNNCRIEKLILIRLVEGGGTWDRNLFKKLKKEDVSVIRHKHFNKTNIKKAKMIYRKIKQNEI